MTRYLQALAAAALLLSATVPSHASRIRRGPTAKHKTSKSSKASTPHQRAIDDARATQIQTALVKAGYLPEVTGHWDSASQAAMQKLQGDNGWQTKLVPDSRALIKLGLGPSAAVQTASGSAIASSTEKADADSFGEK